MNQQDAIEMAVFGVEVERFLAGEIGKYLLDRAEIEREKAISEMKTIDPTNANEVRRVQDGLCIPDKIVKWLSEAIESGRAAHDALQEQEAEGE